MDCFLTKVKKSEHILLMIVDIIHFIVHLEK
jgi:hypothetical protein